MSSKAKKKSGWVKMPSATSIVARSFPDRIIGIENRLPWHLGTDLRLFKERTLDHAIIMGRKTLESIGRPLPNRINIVLSRTEIAPKKNLVWAPDPRTALMLADYYSILNNRKEFFIIGGEQIYTIFDTYINKVFLTDVFCGNINGDAKFEVDFSSKEWWTPSEDEYQASEKDDFAFRITCWMKIKSIHRRRQKFEFLNYDDAIIKRLDELELSPDELEDTIASESSQLTLF
jgi:dihydrofolate reductase